MKKYFFALAALCLLAVVAFSKPTFAFSIIDAQPLLASVETESELAKYTNYPTWLRPSLEKAGWIKKGQVIDGKTALAIERRLCREVLGATEKVCVDTSVAFWILAALNHYSTIDGKIAPDTLLSSAVVRTAVRNRLQSVSENKQTPCAYSLVATLMSVCEALKSGTQAFPGVTKSNATKQVLAAEAAYNQLRSLAADRYDETLQIQYEKELAASGLVSDLDLAKAALKKKRYSEAYVAGLVARWMFESAAQQIQTNFKIKPVATASLVAERKAMYRQQLASFQAKHVKRGDDDAYLLRYAAFTPNLRNVEKVFSSTKFTNYSTDEQLLMYDTAIDLISVIELGSKAKI